MRSSSWAFFIFLLTTIPAAGSWNADRRQPNNVPVIGLLSPGSPSYGAPNIEAFRQGLRELGYIEGKNVAIKYSYAEGQEARYKELAEQFAKLNVDVIVVAATPAIRAVKNATKTIPVVMAAAADPVKTGLIQSLARPGGNVTGLAMRSPEMSGKRLELIKQIIPKIHRVGVFLNPKNPSSEVNLKESRVTARTLGVQLLPFWMENAPGMDPEFDTAIRAGIDSFTVMRDSLLLVNMKRFLAFAAQNRLPAVYDGREFALAGGLMSYTANHLDLYRRAASYVDKILKGARPADLPVEQSMRAEFIINLKAAKEIGLKIAPELVQRADRVIRE